MSFQTNFKQILAAPTFADEEQNRAAGLLHTISLIILVGLASYTLAFLLVAPEQAPNVPIIGLATLTVICAQGLMRRGHPLLASRLLVSVLWGILTIATIIGGGVSSPAFSGYIVIIATSPLLWNRRFSLLFFWLSAAVGGGLVYAQTYQLLPLAYHTPLSTWLAQVMFFGFALFLMSVAANDLRTSLAKAQQEMAERLKAEEALRVSEARNRAILNTIPDLTFRLDHLGQVLDFHAKPGSELYVSEENIKGNTLATMMPPEIAEESLRQIRQTLETGDIQRFEYSLPTSEGTGYFEARLVVSGPEEVFAIIRDITEQKRSSEALQKSEERFRIVSELTSDWATAIRFDQDGFPEQEWAMGAFDRLTGFPLRDRGAQSMLFDIVHPQDKSYILQRRQLALELGTLSSEYRILTKNGEIRWVRDHTRVEYDLDGQPVRAYLAGQDITEYKQADAEIRRRVEELAALRQVSTALRSAQKRAEMLPIILDQVMDLFQAQGAAFEMTTSDGGVLAELGKGIWASVSGTPIPEGEGLTAQVISTAQPYLNNDIQTEPKLYLPDLIGECNAVAGVPLIIHEQVIGLMWIAKKDPIANSELKLLAAIADIAANAIQRTTLHEQTQQRLQRLQGLHAIDLAITSSHDLKVTLDVLLSQTQIQLQVDATAVLLYNPKTQTLEFAAGLGFHSQAMEHIRLRFGEGYAGRAALERRMIHIANIKESERDIRAPILTDEAFIDYCGVPLIAKGQIKGVLELFHRRSLDPQPDWIDFLETLAGQAAIALDSAELFEQLQQSNTELALAYDATIEGWARALGLRDQETEGHSQRVTELVLQLARAVGVPDDELTHIRRGALLHDVGKMGIPDSILLKPGSLDQEEWQIMRQHPQLAYEMLSPIAFLRPALDIPYGHHERWDGQGYPNGLTGEQIPLAARIFAVIDVWDALTSDRPYRPKWSQDYAIRHIKEQAGNKLDPQIVEKFLEILPA